MSKILCIDTATDICSVVLAEDEKIIARRESGDDRSHAVKLAVYIREILNECSLKVEELSAVAVSMGPGSYTGLRIGVSTAKGLCFGANIPLLAVSTLQAMCYGVSKDFIDDNELTGFIFCPMLDARRMEVYTALYNPNYEIIKEITAEVLEPDSYAALLEKTPVIFFGSGAEKAIRLFDNTKAIYFSDFKHSAVNMVIPAFKKLVHAAYEDIAYFEPFYLKDFIATVPKNKIIK